MDHLPELRIHSKRLRSKARYDLRRFLYPRPYSRNGKALDARWFFRKIDQGEFGQPKLERLSLVLALKELLEEKLESGASIASIDSYLAVLQLFFDFNHSRNKSVTLSNLEEEYLEYCEYLFLRCNEKNPTLHKNTAYGYGATLSRIFGEILEIPASIQLINRTRLPYPKVQNRAVSRTADKQHLEDTTKMGSFLVDLISGITIDAVYGALPFKIPRGFG